MTITCQALNAVRSRQIKGEAVGPIVRSPRRVHGPSNRDARGKLCSGQIRHECRQQGYLERQDRCPHRRRKHQRPLPGLAADEIDNDYSKPDNSHRDR